MPTRAPVRRRAQGSGAIGSAPVSKTGGWGFESLLPCESTRGNERAPHGIEDELSETSTTADREVPARRPGIGLFLRQVIAELRKVVWPTRSELLSYTGVVLVFVLVMMLLVSGLDYGIGKLVLLVFGSGS